MKRDRYRGLFVWVVLLGLTAAPAAYAGVFSDLLQKASDALSSKDSPTGPGGTSLKQWPCSDDNRKADYGCADVKDPICAWYKDGHHAEVKNFCEACKDPNVKFYTEPEGSMTTPCPK